MTAHSNFMYIHEGSHLSCDHFDKAIWDDREIKLGLSVTTVGDRPRWLMLDHV